MRSYGKGDAAVALMRGGIFYHHYKTIKVPARPIDIYGKAPAHRGMIVRGHRGPHYMRLSTTDFDGIPTSWELHIVPEALLRS